MPSMKQLPVTTSCVHAWLVGSQASVVQALPSSHWPLFRHCGTTPAQTPAVHVSPIVLALPSLHEVPDSLALLQPLVGSQESAVHALPSSHLAPEMSLWLQAKSAELPAVGSQISLVQTLLSAHGVPTVPVQVVTSQASFTVQKLLSSQAIVPAAACWQPDLPAQLSVVHGLPSSHALLVAVPAHAPPAHASPVVQVTPSSQLTALFVVVQAPARLQPSSVHGLPSLQAFAVPVQVPVPQLSFSVQALLSSHVTLAGSATDVQPLVLLQESVVHALPSSHETLVLLQNMFVHLSVVHALLSLQSLSAAQSGALKPLHALSALPQFCAAHEIHAGSVTVALTKFEQLDAQAVDTQTDKSPKQSAHCDAIGYAWAMHVAMHALSSVFVMGAPAGLHAPVPQVPRAVTKAMFVVESHSALLQLVAEAASPVTSPLASTLASTLVSGPVSSTVSVQVPVPAQVPFLQ